jgi:hypothetical protein
MCYLFTHRAKEEAEGQSVAVCEITRKFLANMSSGFEGTR